MKRFGFHGLWLCLMLLQGGGGCSSPPLCEDCVDCPPQQLFVGYICMQNGMSLDGEVVVSADPLHFATGRCLESSFETVGKGYQACCDGVCCQWQPDNPDYPLEPFADCATDEDCAFGLTCKPAGAQTRGESPDQCQYGAAGEPCDYSHFCEDGLICNHPVHKCVEPVAVEGVYCDPGLHNCILPLQCICPGHGLGCRCYDGSEGDACELGTCAPGLYCAWLDQPSHVSECRDGSVGDPCSWSVQCLDSMTCLQEGNESHCHQWLLAGEPCEAVPYASCMAGLACNTAYDPALCRSPGVDGQPCAEETDCAPGYNCLAESGLCFDGNAGDPCLSQLDCATDTLCIPWAQECSEGKVGDVCELGTCQAGAYCIEELGQGQMTCHDGALLDPCFGIGQCNDGLICMAAGDMALCVVVQGEGESCLSIESGGGQVCGEGLVCNTALEPAQCAPPQSSGEPCMAQEHCAPGHACAPDLQLCTDGQEGAPCSDSLHCSPGLHCIETVSQCFGGEEGDPCAGDFDCQEFLSCNDGECQTGLEGYPCVGPESCQADLYCAYDGMCHDGDEEDPCTLTEECLPGLECVAGKCSG